MQKRKYINLSNEFIVHIDKILGQGSTGVVCEATHLTNANQKVAVKIIDLSTIDNEVTEYLLKMEKLALSTLQSRYILKCLKIAQNKKYCFMVTEYCDGGTLKNYIKESNPQGYLSQEQSFKIIQCILQGYEKLVDKKIVHRDLKPANIMIHKSLAKIIDFGYCEIAGHKKPNLQYNVGSPSYMAPQSYKMSVYNEKTQIWAIGVILFECLTGKTLDEGREMIDTFKEMKELGIPYPQHVSEKSKKLVSWCLSMNPSIRPTCKQLLNSQFFKRQPLQAKFQISRTNTKNLGIKRDRPQSQYQKLTNQASQPEQMLTLSKSNYYAHTTQRKQVQIPKQKLPFKKQKMINYENNPKKTSYNTDRIIPQTYYSKEIKNTDRNSKYEMNRFKPTLNNYCPENRDKIGSFTRKIQDGQRIKLYQRYKNQINLDYAGYNQPHTFKSQRQKQNAELYHKCQETGGFSRHMPKTEYSNNQHLYKFIKHNNQQLNQYERVRGKNTVYQMENTKYRA